VWPPAETLPRPRIGEEEGELSTLMRGMMNAQANDSGWPTFSGKYVEYPRFRKEWWAYRQTYHGHLLDELVCRSLKEKSLAGHVRLLVNDIDDLREAWDTLNTCYDRPDKFFYIMYFGYLLHPPPPLCELARPAEWGFVYMVITGQHQKKEYFIVLRCYDSF
jgi:hypothetical protein